MSFPVPTPQAIADEISTEIEQRLSLSPDGTPRAIDARSGRSVLAAIARALAGGLFETHLHLRRIADDMMPDTADEAALARHAAIWGVARRAAVRAVGQVIFTGGVGGAVPSGTELALSGRKWITTAAGVIGAGGTATIPVQATVAGAAGNVAAGTRLDTVSPLLVLTSQQVVVAAGGIAGGADIETVDSWRARILQRIREPAHGGAASDYAQWAAEAMAIARVAVRPAWVGAGSVGILFLMPDAAALSGLRVPTAAEIATMDAYLQALAPVTAEVVTVGATLQPVNITIQVNPDSAAAITAVDAAVRAWLRSAEFDIGTPLRLSRLGEAISAATGEAWHRIVAPAADVVPATGVQLTLGALTITGVAS